MGKPFRVLVVLLLLVLLAGFFAVQWLQRSLTAAGIEQLDWQELGWSRQALQLGQLSGRYVAEQGQLSFEIRQLEVRLGWQAGLQVKAVEIGRLQLDWASDPVPAADQPITAQALPDPRDWSGYLERLPFSSRVHELVVNMPCQTGSCRMQGDLLLERETAPLGLTALATLQAGEETLLWSLRVQQQGDALDVYSGLNLSANPALQLHGSWQGAGAETRWQGQLLIPQWPQADWLLAFVEPWLAPGSLPFKSLPEGLELEAGWLMQPGSRPESVAELLAGEVQLNLRAQLEQPWRLEEIGALSGSATLQVQGREGRWLLQQGAGQLSLREPALTALREVPGELLPSALLLEIKPQADTELDWQQVMPLDVSLRLEGPLSGSLVSRLNLRSLPAWQAQLAQARLQLQLGKWAADGISLAAGRIDWPLQAEVDELGLQLSLGSAALLTANRLEASDPALRLDDLRLELGGLKLDLPWADPAALQLDAPFKLGLGRLQQAQLKPQGWALQGRVRQAPDSGLQVDSSATAISGLGLDLALRRSPAAAWQADIRLQDTFLRAANPLAATLADWPQLLTLSTGRVQGSFKARGNPGLEQLDGNLVFSGVAGIYDRASFQGLSFPLSLSLRGDALALQTSDLTLTSMDPGIPLGPLAFAGGYRVGLQELERGQLALEKATLGLLGGQLQVEPATLDLKQSHQQLLVNLKGVELARLFEVYPAEGLSGQGTLDGRLPIGLADGKLVIDSGQLRAREPGGVLQYRSEKLQEMGRSNPGMRELATALDDFRYTVLASDVAYGEEGVLQLGLRLEGRNPALQQGRPVHLNITLEEDIPALLASLQLSGQVSDIIQKRVQQRLLERRGNP